MAAPCFKARCYPQDSADCIFRNPATPRFHPADSAAFRAKMAVLPGHDTVHRIPPSTRRESGAGDSPPGETPVKARTSRGGGLQQNNKTGS